MVVVRSAISSSTGFQFEKQVRSVYQQMARILIEPRWARYYDFAAGRLPEFLLKLVSGDPG